MFTCRSLITMETAEWFITGESLFILNLFDTTTNFFSQYEQLNGLFSLLYYITTFWIIYLWLYFQLIDTNKFVHQSLHLVCLLWRFKVDLDEKEVLQFWQTFFSSLLLTLGCFWFECLVSPWLDLNLILHSLHWYGLSFSSAVFTFGSSCTFAGAGGVAFCGGRAWISTSGTDCGWTCKPSLPTLSKLCKSII